MTSTDYAGLAPMLKEGSVAIGDTGDRQPAWYPLVYGGDSVASGMIVGGSGSGTTYLAVVIAAAVRAAVPTTTVHLDPFGGRSSRDLSRHATYAYHGDDEIAGALARLDELQRRRWCEAAGACLRGQLEPLVLVVVHEPRLVFRRDSADGWFQLTRLARKVGVGLLVVGGSGELEEFGGHVGLRGLISNVIGLRSLRAVSPFGLDAPTLNSLPRRGAVMSSTLVGGHRRFEVPEIEPAALLTRHPDASTPAF